MLDNDIYVLKKNNGITDAGGAVTHLGMYLHSHEYATSPFSLDDLVLVLCAYCGYVSYESISVAYPIYSSAFQKTFTRLKKKMLIREFSLKVPEGRAKILYMCTPEGFRHATSVCGGKLSVNKIQKTKSHEKCNHAYLIGYNMMQMLTLNMPFVWQKEVPFYNTQKGSRSYVRGDLQVDAICDFYPDNKVRHKAIYIEQDRGTENRDIVFSKLSNYYSSMLMNPDTSVIVYSFAKSGVSTPLNSANDKGYVFSVKKCNALLSYMDKNNLSDLCSIEPSLFDSDDYLVSARPFVTNFMVTVGAAYFTGNGEFVIKKGTTVIDTLFVKEFIKGITLRNNPYQSRIFNLEHEKLSWQRLSSLASSIIDNISSAPTYAIPLMRGFSCLFTATTLIADRIPIAMLSEDDTLRDGLAQTLRKSFGDVSFISELSSPIILDEHGEYYICMRNAFSYTGPKGTKGTVCVEFPSHDLGAWIRCFYFIHMKNYKHLRKDGPVHVVCVFDNKLHMSFFSKTLSYLNKSQVIDLSDDGMEFLMTYDIGKESINDESCLFYVTEPFQYKNTSNFTVTVE